MRLNYPEILPIAAHRREIVEAIKQNQVVIVVGETGSGKSTQIPKMIVEAFCEIEKIDPTMAEFKIACTQPRRIAAVSIATWMAQEMGVELGKEVGYKIRFDDETTVGTLINICTDGILLQEMKGDGLLSRYDAVLVDEAHERNLNIDFLLGLIKDIQKKRLAAGRKELKVLVTSATVDAGKFADFFAELNNGPIPIINVSGRLYPVDIVYKPLEGRDDPYKKISALIKGMVGKGDVLIFMPGEGEIFSCIEEIERGSGKMIKCLPLFSRLPMEEQELIYNVYPGMRKVVVATNIAETSLTVPGIKYVIDAGLARMTDFNYKTGIGSLEVREISQASAIQRAGRAGRVEPGICYRLYDEENFLERERYTKPEIQRSDLSSVVLHMKLMGITDLEKFSFIDKPESKAFHNAIVNLIGLGALDDDKNLTALGVKMAHLPLEPRISAMLLAAERYDCVREVAIIASSLSVKDPFIRPNGEEDEADRAKRNFQRMAAGGEHTVRYITLRRGRKFVRKKVYEDDGDRQMASDLLVFLVVWNKIQSLPEEQRETFCQSNYLNYLVFQEIFQIYHQLLDTLKTFAKDEFSKYLADQENLIFGLENREGILKAISSGFIQNLCEATNKVVYKSRGVEGIMIHPGSALFNINPRWFVSAEIVETTKLFARNNTMIDISWLEEIAPQLCRVKRGEVYFDRVTGRLMREESVYFRDSRVIRSRTVDLSKENAVQAEEYLIKEGLVKGQLARQFSWIGANFETMRLARFYAKMLDLDVKKLFGEERLFKWYQQKFSEAGGKVKSLHDLKKVIDQYGKKYLFIQVGDLLTDKQLQLLKEKYPDKVYLAGREYNVEYLLDHDEAKSGPVIKLLVGDLDGLDSKVQKDLGKLKPHFQVYSSDAYQNLIAESEDIDELKKEVDYWYLRKAWKKARRGLEVKSFRLSDFWPYSHDLLKKVEIGMSRFDQAEKGMVYGYIGLKMDGKKVLKTIFEDEQTARLELGKVLETLEKYLQEGENAEGLKKLVALRQDLDMTE